MPAHHCSMLTETTLGIIHGRLAHVIGGNPRRSATDILYVDPTIHLRCLPLLDSLLVHLSGIGVEASVSSRSI